MALEYLNRFEHYFINDTVSAAKFVDEVNHPNFKLHYDTFHSNIEEKNIAESVRAGGKRIAHVHISENDRSTPGEGHVRWDETFTTLAEIGYDGWLMIEAFGAALPEIAGATCIWRQMFPNEEYLATNGLAVHEGERGEVLEEVSNRQVVARASRPCSFLLVHSIRKTEAGRPCHEFPKPPI